MQSRYACAKPVLLTRSQSQKIPATRVQRTRGRQRSGPQTARRARRTPTPKVLWVHPRTLLVCAMQRTVGWARSVARRTYVGSPPRFLQVRLLVSQPQRWWAYRRHWGA